MQGASGGHGALVCRSERVSVLFGEREAGAFVKSDDENTWLRWSNDGRLCHCLGGGCSVLAWGAEPQRCRVPTNSTLMCRGRSLGAGLSLFFLIAGDGRS
jgi:hypothetical protein